MRRTAGTHASIAAVFACLVLAAVTVRAEDAPTFAPEELEQVVAPIALYPDSLLAQVLMASTYPLEVVEAARFAAENPSLEDAKLDEALKDESWDPSVKSLVSFPQVLTMMNEKLDWTQKLGDAFLAQQKDVMDAVQRLRARAHAEGNLASTAEQKVIVEPAPTQVVVEQAPTQVVVQQAPPTVIQIEQTNPQVVYVPTYDPVIVYGAWPYPAYPPYYYYPPGYVAGMSMLSFGAGMAVGAAIWGDCDWGHGDVDIDVNEYNNFTNNTNRERNRTDVEGGDRGREGDRAEQRDQRDRGRQGDRGGKDTWKHDPSHRKGVQYRDTASQQKYDRAGPRGADSREAFRGRAEQGREQMKREGTSAVQRDVDRANTQRDTASRDRAAGATRDRSGETSRRDAGNTARDRSGEVQRSASSRDYAGSGQRSGSSNRSSVDRGRGSEAFKGAGGQGSQVRRDSSRGQSSRASASRGSRGGGSRGGRGGGGRR